MNSVSSGCMLSLFILIYTAMSFICASHHSVRSTRIKLSHHLYNDKKFRQDSKSLRYRMNRNGPRQDPCSIPHMTGRELGNGGLMSNIADGHYDKPSKPFQLNAINSLYLSDRYFLIYRVKSSL